MNGFECNSKTEITSPTPAASNVVTQPKEDDS